MGQDSSVTTNGSNLGGGKYKHPSGLKLANICIALQSMAGYAVISFMILFFTAGVNQNGLGLSVQKATGMLGLYSGLGYMTPLIGGWLTDRYLGLQKGILLGSILAFAGYMALFLSTSSVASVWLGLGIMICSGAFFKGNISALVGELYSKAELSKKDAAYSYFYMATNIGSLLGPIIAGLITDSWFAKVSPSGEIISYGYRYGFLLSAIMMLITFLVFLFLAPKWLKNVGKKPASTISKEKVASSGKEDKLTTLEKRRMIAMVIIFVFVVLFWAAWFQTQSSFALLSDKLVDRNAFGKTIPVPWLTSFNGILCVVLSPLLGGLWVRLAKTKRGDFSIPTKMGLGMILSGFAFIILILGINTLGGVEDGSIKMNIAFLLLSYLVLTIGELFLSPIGMAMFNKLAPSKYASLAMGAWYLCFFFANIISGKVAGFTESMGYSEVFALIAGVVIFFGIILILLRKLLNNLMAIDRLEE